MLNQEAGFDGGRLRYWGVGASAISTGILQEEGGKIFDGFDQRPAKVANENSELSLEEINVLYDYFNLCGEEYFFYK